MAGGTSRKISAASARSHTRRTKKNTSFQLPSGMFNIALAVVCIGIMAWTYQKIQPPPSKLCSSPDGPPVTAPRIKLRDGRHLAYKEHGISKDIAKHKIIHVHGYSSCRHDVAAMHNLSPEIVQQLGIYVVSFDKPGYGESDPDPKRSAKSLALDIEEIADKLGLGSKFYVIGMSLGGQAVWGCLKYIPHRLAGAVLLAPAINYWWTGLPANVSKEAYYQMKTQDQWGLRVVHYTPWLTYWWNTQKWFPALSVVTGSDDILSHQDKLITKDHKRKWNLAHVTQQGVHESLHRDLTIGFGTWEFSPVDLENPFPNSEGSVHLWQGAEDRLVPVTLQRYIADKLPWIHYHELPDAGHSLPMADGMSDTIMKSLLTGGH